MLKKFVYASLSVVKHNISFAIFGLLCSFFIFFLPFVAIFCLGSKRHLVMVSQFITHKAFQFVVWFCRATGFIDISVIYHAQQNLAPIVVCNHLSLFDIVTIFCYFPGSYTFVHRKYLKNPLLAPIIHACNYIPIDPTSISDRMHAYAQAEEILKQGGRLVIFPEGTRSLDGKMLPFQKGAFNLASKLQLAISPIFFTADRAFLNKNKIYDFRLDCPRLEAHIMPPIVTKEIKAQDLKHHTELLFQEWTKSPLTLAWNKSC